MPKKSHQFETVWKSIPEATAADLVAFWMTHRALPTAEKAQARTKQAALVVRDQDQAIVGVSTAYGQYSKQLNNRFLHFRAFVAPSERRGGLFNELLVRTRDLLEANHANGIDTDCIGLLLEVESPLLKQHKNQAVWPEGPVFIGMNARGDHLRVVYFQGARIS